MRVPPDPAAGPHPADREPPSQGAARRRSRRAGPTRQLGVLSRPPGAARGAPRGSRLSTGKPAHDAQPLTGRAQCLDGSAGGCDDMLDDREPETGAARRACLVGAVEPLEDAGKLALAHAGAVVRDDELARVAVPL